MQLRRATPEDVFALDFQEHDLMHMEDFFGEVPSASKIASGATVAVHEGEVIALFGCSPSPSNQRIGCPWLLLGEQAGRITTARLSRFFVDQWLEEFDALFNYVHPSNLTSQKWLTWLGFQPGPVEFVGVHDKPFIPYFKVKA